MQNFEENFWKKSNTKKQVYLAFLVQCLVGRLVYYQAEFLDRLNGLWQKPTSLYWASHLGKMWGIHKKTAAV